jgi:membrane protease YdiL (CAAX protease family)
MRSFVARFPVLTFVVLTLAYQFVVVGIVWWRSPAGGHMHDDATAHMVFRFRVFGPLVFAMLLTAYLEGRAGLRNLFGSFLHWRVPARWYLLAFSWKFLFTWVGIGTLVLLGFRAWPGFFVDGVVDPANGPLKGLLHTMPFIVGIALVEETAWMKFCVTRLQERFHALPACLLVGVSWGLWYLPMLLVGEGVPDGYPWPVFMTSMVALTILLAWAYNMTRSGTVLLIMQIVSNCAFFLLPVLPGLHDLDAAYVNAFVGANAASALLLVLVFGWRELGTGRRATWSEGMQHEPSDAGEQKPLDAPRPVGA